MLALAFSEDSLRLPRLCRTLVEASFQVRTFPTYHFLPHFLI